MHHLVVLAALFYTREEIGMRTAYCYGFATVAGAFSGLIAFGIQHLHAALANWRLLFIIEGIPTVLLGICAIFILPSRPEDTIIFNEKEREIALERRNRGRKGDIGRMVQKSMCLNFSHDRPPRRNVWFTVIQPTSSLHSKTGRCVKRACCPAISSPHSNL